MKILLVSDKDLTKELLSLHLGGRGFDIIRYINPIKAMDNLDEIEPDVVLFSAEDYPKHWKVFLQFLRAFRNREKTPFILLTGENFELEEASKAIFLGVNGILAEDFQDELKFSRLEELLSRYKIISDQRTEMRYIPDPVDEIDLVFNHPESMKLITGRIKNISLSSTSFLPDNPQITLDLKTDTRISHCSLKIGNKIISFPARILRNNQLLILRFDTLSEENRTEIIDYLDLRAERKLAHLIDEPEELEEYQ